MHSDTLRCRCGFEFSFQPEDRGFMVYCPSCAQECAAPGESAHAVTAAAVPDVTAESGSRSAEIGADLSTPRRRSSIFSQERFGDVASQTVAEITCLCGGRVAVSPSDYGATVYCPSCGAELTVGERFDRWRAVQAPATTAADTETNAVVERSHQAPPKSSSFRSVRSLVAVVGAIVLVTVAWQGAVWLLRPSSDRANVWAALGGLKLRGGSNVTNPAKAGAAATSHADEVEPQPVPDPADEITFEQIEALLSNDDRRAALIDAEVWRQLLIDRGLTVDEPRRQRLDVVIARLIDALTPRPQPPDPVIGQFGELLARLRDVLAVEDLAAAHTLSDDATALFRSHSDVLAPYSRRLLVQQALLKRLESRREGVTIIERLLQKAKSEAEAGNVLESLEARASAMNMAHEASGISEPDEKRLQTMAAELRGSLRLARGTRAVEEAERCHDEQDRTNRDAQLQLARSLLPGLPESQIKSLMATAEKLANSPIARSRDSAVGQEIAVRTLYENGLEHYSRGELKQLVDAAEEAGRNRDSTAAEMYLAKLAALTFSVLEARLSDVVAGSIPAGERGAVLADLQSACDKLSSSNDDNRFAALRAACEQQARELAEKAVSHAQRLAASGHFAEAVEAILPATQLGPATERDDAKKLRAQWQAEQELRESLPAQAEHWRRIQDLAKANAVAAAAREAALFERRYPRTPHAAAMAALKVRLLPVVKQMFEDHVTQAEAAWQAQNWPEFMEEYAQLEPLAAMAGQESTMERLRQQKARLQVRIEGRMQEVKRSARMIKDDEIIAVLEAAKEVLSIEPDHEWAKKLLNSARVNARERAARILKKAEAFRRNKLVNATCQKLLESVVKLDPDGECGRSARKQLDEMRAK